MAMPLLRRKQRSPSLSITTTSDVVLLNPSAHPSCTSTSSEANAEYLEGTEELPEALQPSIIRGYVTLTLPKPKVIRGLRVELACRQTVQIDGYKHAYTLEQCHTDIMANNQYRSLPAGSHVFPFCLVLPHDIAPSERCFQGRSMHKLVASAQGLGSLGTALCALCPIQLEPMHRDIAGLPTGYHLNNVSQNHNLGPVVLKIHSKHLLTSGFVRMNLQLPKLAKAIRLDEIRLNVEQQTETQCLDEQDKRGTRFTEIIPLWTSRTSDLKGKTKSPGDCFSIDQHVRMLGEDRIRPSTPEASHTGIRVNHRISCTIVYLPLENNPRMEKKEYRVASGALVSSCHSLLDALQLPAYSEQGVKMDHIEHVKTASSPCLCTVPDSEALQTYGASISDTQHPEDPSVPCSMGPDGWRLASIRQGRTAFQPRPEYRIG